MKMRTLAFALVAAALSQTAGAITATKEYVDRKIGETAPDYATVSNRAMSAIQSHQDISGKADKSDTYTKAETDARIGELAPRTSLEPATNYTDEVAAYKRGVKDLAVYGGYAPWNVPYFPEPAQWKPEIGYWEAADYEWGDFWYFRWKSGVWEFYNAIYPDETDPSIQPSDVSTNGEYALSVHFPNYDITITRTSIYATNGAHIVTSDDIAPAVSNTVTKAYVENLGIESGIQFEEDPHWEAAKGGYATTGTVAQVSEAVGTLWSYVYGDSVWIAVTNYMRTVGGVSPSFQLWEVRDGVTNLVYWSKEEITNVTHDLIHDCKTNLEATVRNAVAEMPDKAWSKYQSATGNEAPEGVTIVSTPTIQLTGGGEWYRYIDVASNSVWFLKSNGLHTFGGDTNGYFRILDDEGNATFEVRKTDSYLVDAVASSVHFDADGNFCVSFESNIEPVIYTTASLENPNFLPQGDDPNVTVTWTQSGGTYTATLEQTVKGPSLFAYAKVEVQGETVIRNTVPTDLQGGIMLNGVKYSVGTATIDNKTVLTLTPRN